MAGDSEDPVKSFPFSLFFEDCEGCHDIETTSEKKLFLEFR